MALNRDKSKGRRDGDKFFALPYAVIESFNFQKLSGYAVKLLVQMGHKLRFQKGGTKNNGDLCVSWSVMKEQGWRSKDTLQRARNELLYYGFIEQTRMGLAMVKGKPHLYALTFLAIDEFGGKLDVAATRVPTGKWKEEQALYKPPGRANT